MYTFYPNDFFSRNVTIFSLCLVVQRFIAWNHCARSVTKPNLLFPPGELLNHVGHPKLPGGKIIVVFSFGSLVLIITSNIWIFDLISIFQLQFLFFVFPITLDDVMFIRSFVRTSICLGYVCFVRQVKIPKKAFQLKGKETMLLQFLNSVITDRMNVNHIKKTYNVVVGVVCHTVAKQFESIPSWKLAT